MAVQRLGLYASTVGGLGLVLDLGTKIPKDEGHSQRKKKKSLEKRPCEDKEEKAVICKPRREALKETNSTDSLIFNY